MIKYASQYINSAAAICKLYDGSMPLAAFLKQYFQLHKKYGSSDRRHISHLCYCYYRLGHTLKEHTGEERLKAALFLCTERLEEWSALYDAAWLENINKGLQEKISFIQSIYSDFSLRDIFLWIDELSEGIDWEAFAISHFIQPDLFLRARPGKEQIVLKKFAEAQLPFKQLSENCFALPNGTKIDGILETDKEVVVQDYNSQQVAKFFSPVVESEASVINVWDCCAASGGKSILAYDNIPKINLSVSDIRVSIIQNLKKRFERAGINNYNVFVTDAVNSKSQMPIPKLIICDAPCTGSGTWGRTPEQLYFFSAEKISEYAALQKKIVRSIIPALAENGWLLYITCSVFTKENEEMAHMIETEFSLQMVKKELLKGYGMKADSMFAVLFKK